MYNTNKSWVAYRTKIVSSGSPSYTVQGAASIVRPNGRKKVRFFADKGLFSVADKAEISFFGDSSELNLKSKLRANQNDLKDHLKPITPTKTVELLFFSFMAGWEKEGGQWFQRALVGYLLIPFHVVILETRPCV